MPGTKKGTVTRTLVGADGKPDSEARQAEAGPSQANGRIGGTRTPTEANLSSITKEVSQRHGDGAANGASGRSADLSLRHLFHQRTRLEDNKQLISLVMEDQADLLAGAQLSLPPAKISPMPLGDWDSSDHISHVQGARLIKPTSTGDRISQENARHVKGMKRTGVEVAPSNIHQFQESQKIGQPTVAENLDNVQGSKGTDGNPQIGLKSDIQGFEKFLPAGRVNNCGDSSGSTSGLGEEIVPFKCLRAGVEVATGLQSLCNRVEICSSKATSEENVIGTTAVDINHMRNKVQIATVGVAATQDDSDGQLETALLDRTLVEKKKENSGELEIAFPENQHMGGSLNGSERMFEQCVQAIRWLEREGHLKAEFRKSFFTWLSLCATEVERKVVHIVMENMLDDPVSLAAQLLDTFQEISAPKRLKVWH